MVASRMMQARVPDEIQDVATQVIQASGLTVSDVVRVLITCIAQNWALPPELFQPDKETLEACDEIEQGKPVRFACVDALYDDLRADD